MSANSRAFHHIFPSEVLAPGKGYELHYSQESKDSLQPEEDNVSILWDKEDQIMMPSTEVRSKQGREQSGGSLL